MPSIDTYKQITIQGYDRYTDTFDQKFEHHFHTFVKPKAALFLDHLPGKKVLDIGSGPGNHALYLQQAGLDMLCGDLSDAMVQRCREKGLKAKKMDIEHLDFREQAFDGIWAYAILLHIKKERAQAVIDALHRVLKPNGILVLGVKEGEGEGFETHHSYPDTERWFSYFTDTEARELLKAFDIFHTAVSQDKQTFLHYTARKVNSVIPP